MSECLGCHCPECVYIYQRWHLNAAGICSGYLQQNIPRYHTKDWENSIVTAVSDLSPLYWNLIAVAALLIAYIAGDVYTFHCSIGAK